MWARTFWQHTHKPTSVLFCSILAVQSREDARIYLLLTTTGHYSLFPLVFTAAGKCLRMRRMILLLFILLTLCEPSWSLCRAAHQSAPDAHLCYLLLHCSQETSRVMAVKSVFTVTLDLWTQWTLEGLIDLFYSPVSSQGPLLHPLESVYLLGLAPVAVACEVVFPLSSWQQKLPFLPLLVTSVYCSLGVCYSFLRLYCSLLKGHQKHKRMWGQRWVVLVDSTSLWKEGHLKLGHKNMHMRTLCWAAVGKMRFKGSSVFGRHNRLLGEKFSCIFVDWCNMLLLFPELWDYFHE